MTDPNPQPTPAPPAAPAPAPEAPKPGPPADPGKQPPWGKPENFDADKAWELIENLRKEKGGDTDALKTQLETIQQQQEKQRMAMAEALGLTEAPKSEDALAETVKNLQRDFAATQHEARLLRAAADNNIPPEFHDLLTETDPDKLAAQAVKIGALVTAHSTASGTPSFQPNPGQGQGGQPPTPEALEAAEYAKFYPPSA